MIQFVNRTLKKGVTHRLTQVEGPDAADFLQRLTTVHIRVLPTQGAGHWGAFLSAQGKVESFFRIWKLREDAFLVETTDTALAPGTSLFLETIERMTFSESLTVRTLPEVPSLLVLGHDITPPSLVNATVLTLHESEWKVPAFLIFGEEAVLHGWTSQIPPGKIQNISIEEIEALRIENAKPAWGTEILPQSNLIECGLPEAIDEQKGCYPGQEVGERVRAIGSPAKRLVLWKADRPFHLSQLPVPIYFERDEVGTLTSSSGQKALALVRKNSAQVDQTLQIFQDDQAIAGRILEVAPFAIH